MKRKQVLNVGGQVFTLESNRLKKQWRGETRTAIYIGKDKLLQGKMAMVSRDGFGGLEAQFDSMDTGMGTGWHVFECKEFRVLGKLNLESADGNTPYANPWGFKGEPNEQGR